MPPAACCTGALGGLSFVAQIVSGALLALVFLLYIVTDGDAIWRWIQDRFSAGSRRDGSRSRGPRRGTRPAATCAASRSSR